MPGVDGGKTRQPVVGQNQIKRCAAGQVGKCSQCFYPLQGADQALFVQGPHDDLVVDGRVLQMQDLDRLVLLPGAHAGGEFTLLLCQQM